MRWSIWRLNQIEGAVDVITCLHDIKTSLMKISFHGIPFPLLYKRNTQKHICTCLFIKKVQVIEIECQKTDASLPDEK